MTAPAGGEGPCSVTSPKRGKAAEGANKESTRKVYAGACLKTVIYTRGFQFLVGEGEFQGKEL